MFTVIRTTRNARVRLAIAFAGAGAYLARALVVV